MSAVAAESAFHMVLELCHCATHTRKSTPVTTVYVLTTGPGTATDGSGERRAAHHIVRAANHGPGNVWGSGPNHHAGPCVWSTRTAAGKQLL